MKITESTLKDVFIVEPRLFQDKRGHFFESYNLKSFETAGLKLDFKQDNQSFSKYGVIRGLHFQLEPKAQTKLVRVLDGCIFDVAVDLRKGSPNYGQWFGIELSAENRKQLLIPKGFAHGFSVLSKSATIMYKCDEFYSSENDSGIAYNDPTIGIDWKLPEKDIILSEKDLQLPPIKKANINFSY